MNTLSASRAALRLGCLAALVLSTLAAQAQTANRSVRQVAPRPVPTVTPGTGFGTPNAAGLPSPSANPAGLPSPLPNPGGIPSITNPNLTSPATPGNTITDEAATPQQPNVMGGAAYGGGRPTAAAAVTGPLTALQIAQSFLAADLNRDGELTRAEAQRLTIAPFPFEEMDRDRNGILTRSEYEDALR